MEVVKNCQYGMNCRNLTCSYNHPGRSECRYNSSCAKPYQCWYNHQIRVMRTDVRECKFMDSCHSSVCIFNHPGRPFCAMEEECTDPACQNNHHVLICKFGCACNNEFCEFRHPGMNSAEEMNNVKEDSSWGARRRRTKEMRVDDMIVSMNFEDQLMFENDIGQFMYTDPAKLWPSSNNRREVAYSQGKALRIKVPKGRNEESSYSQHPHQRTGNLIVLKDNENGLERSDLRHSLQPKLNEQGKQIRSESEDSKREWRYERKDCYPHKVRSQVVKVEENCRKPLLNNPPQPFQGNTNIDSQNLTVQTVDLISQQPPQVSKRIEIDLRSSQSSESSLQSVESRSSPKCRPSREQKRFKAALKIEKKRPPSRTGPVKVKAADIETNAAVAAVIKKRTLDSQELPSAIETPDDSQQETTESSPAISVALRFQQLPSDVTKKSRSLKRKHVSTRPEVSIKRKKNVS